MKTACPEVYAKRATAVIFEIYNQEVRKKSANYRQEIINKKIDREIAKSRVK